MRGNAGDDTLDGTDFEGQTGPHADILKGADGDDLLIGDSGDTMTGGSETDAFSLLWRAGSDPVTITDFGVGGNGGEALQIFAVPTDPTSFTYAVREDGTGSDLFIDGELAVRLDGVTDPLSAGSITLGSGDISLTPESIATAGNDVITLSGDMTTVSGLGGDDRIYGSDAAETIAGDSGNDSIEGGWGADSLLGGEGADSILGGVGNDSIFGQDGNDRLNGDDGHDLMFGGEGDDRIHGDFGDDTIDAGDGNDTVGHYWHGGRDVIQLGDGDDLLNSSGGEGDDVNGEGGAGNDTMLGGDGSDTFDGGSGIDLLNGFWGDDVLSGDGADSLFGGDGNDRLFLEGDGINHTPVAGVLDGGAGADRLSTDAAAVTMTGGEGIDSYQVYYEEDPIAGAHSGLGVVITDFDPATETLRIDTTPIESSWTALNLIASADGSDTIVRLGTRQMFILQGVTPAEVPLASITVNVQTPF